MKVDPERYLEHLRVAHNLLALNYDGVDPSWHAIRPGVRKRKSISTRRDL